MLFHCQLALDTDLCNSLPEIICNCFKCVFLVLCTVHCAQGWDKYLTIISAFINMHNMTISSGRLLVWCFVSSSEWNDVWLWSHQAWTSKTRETLPLSEFLGVPLIGDHVFVPDRLWNGVLLHGCVAPAPLGGDWLVWSCGMFPSGLQ